MQVGGMVKLLLQLLVFNLNSSIQEAYNQGKADGTTTFIETMPESILNAATGVGHTTIAMINYKPYTKIKIHIECNEQYSVTDAYVYIDGVLKSTTLTEADTIFEVPYGKVLYAGVSIVPSAEVAIYASLCK